eukprot:IDg15486t1
MLIHDPTCTFLLLKIAIISKAPNVVDLLSNILADQESNINICMASIALLVDAGELAIALNGYKTIYDRFSIDTESLLSKICPFYFDGLISIGDSTEALRLLDNCFEMIILQFRQLASQMEVKEEMKHHIARHYEVWTDKALTSGCTLASREDFRSATLILDRTLRFANKMQTTIDRNQMKF